MTDASRPSRFFGTAARAAATFLAFAIASYAVAYLVFRSRMFPPGFGASFSARPWGIYPHAFFGSIALAVGSLQFWRNQPYRRPVLHRRLGVTYVVAAFGVGVAGLYMSFYSFGGAVTHVGFGLLAVALLTCTTIAYRRILRRDVDRHREWMLRSYALMFAAVMLRLELPLLTLAFHAFAPAYRIVSWLCWVPNLLVAEAYIRRSRARVDGWVADARPA